MKLEEYKVSIIVPIYNVDKYLNKCISSICVQTHKNVEIILVDDGSTDESAKICDEYVKIDKRVHVIHQKNGGLTFARKAGLCFATGEYIGFVDGDDWIEPDMYETMLKCAVESESQMVLCDMYRHKFTGEITIWSGANLSDGLHVMRDEAHHICEHMISGISSENNGINGGVPVKLFEQGILRKCMLSLDDSIHGFADDKIIVYGVILNSDRIYVVHKPFYHGVDRKDSITHSINHSIFYQIQMIYDYLRGLFATSPDKSELLIQLYKFLMISSIQNVDELAGEMIVPVYYFPKNDLIWGKKVILYGAGKVGKSFYRQIRSGNKSEIVLWVDQSPNIEAGVNSVDSIMKTNFDVILIANKEKDMADQIEQKLNSVYGIDLNKIIWEKPCNIIEYYEVNHSQVM